MNKHGAMIPLPLALVKECWQWGSGYLVVMMMMMELATTCYYYGKVFSSISVTFLLFCSKVSNIGLQKFI